MDTEITVEADIDAAIEKVWEFWTEPAHIQRWAFASPDWQVPAATNDVKVGGLFTTRMEAKDGSEGFDVSGTYTTVEKHTRIEYEMDDGRGVRIEFIKRGEGCTVKETFEPEDENPHDIQRDGWQSILNNFKEYAEGQ